MSQQLIDIGVQGNDGTGDSIRTSFQKVNQNFSELYAVFGGGGTIGLGNLGDAPVTKSFAITSVSTLSGTARLTFTNPETGHVGITAGTPFSIGQTVIVTGLLPDGYNGAHVVTASDSTSVSFASTQTGSLTQPGYVSSNAAYSTNQVIMSSTNGQLLTARNIRGVGGITIDATSDYDLIISSANTGVSGDAQPSLSAPLNASGFTIGRVANPSQALVDSFNAIYAGKTPTTLEELAINVGYANEHFVSVSDGQVVGALKPRSEPTAPAITDPDYDPTLNSNYLSSEALPRKDVVYRGGDSMTGALTLNDHPSPMEGLGAPNGSDDLQAATKFYVDNSTYYSGVNLYVSAAKGDDTQSKTPVGREGRAWQYAYKTVGAACLQAENLINLSQTEPGPYRQTIAYTVGPTQYKSTIQSVALSGGNSSSTNYNNASALLQANKQFIQYETIAYLNKKYVNAFTFDKTEYTGIIDNILTGVGYDLVTSALDGSEITTYNATTLATEFYNSYNSNIITNQLTQIIDGINYAKNQILDYSYNVSNTETYIGSVIDALCFDMLFGSTYQSYQVGLKFPYAGTGLSNTEILDLIDSTSINVTSVSDTGTSVTVYFDILSAVPYKVGSSIIVKDILPSGYNGTYVVTGCTNRSVTFASTVRSTYVSGGTIQKNNVISNILNVNGVSDSPTAVASLISNAGIISNIIAGYNYSDPTFPNLTGTSTGKTSAKLLLLENIDFIQAEVVAYLLANYPDLSYSKDYCTRDVKYIVWSLIYDLLYGGNSQSVYAGQRYFLNGYLDIASYELTATLDAVNYINTLAQAIITNSSPAKVYQQTVIQYTNETYTSGSSVSSSISSNVTTIVGIINQTASNPSVVLPTVSAASSILQTNRTNILTAKATIEGVSISYTNANYPVLNNTVINSSINKIFKVITDLLTYGISTRSTPTYHLPSGLTSGYTHAYTAIRANIGFIADEAVGWMNINFPSVTGVNDKSKRDLKYLLEAVLYDMIYQGNSASVAAAKQYWLNGISNIPLYAGLSGACYAAINYAQTLTGLVAQNTVVNPTYSSTIQNTTTYVGTDGSAAVTAINALFITIKDIVANNSEPTITLPALSNFDVSLKSAQTIITNNLTTISSNTINYLTSTYVGGFNYNESICFRDIGYIIDGQAIDLLTGGNYQSVNSGKSYYRNASARSIAIGIQLTETLDGIVFAKELARQVLTNTTRNRYQSTYTQVIDLTKTLNDSGINAVSDSDAVATFKSNYALITNIISQGYGAAPTVSFGTGVYTITFNNGGNGYVDQGGNIVIGQTSGIDIIPGKILLGNTSNAYGQIISYKSGNDAGIANDTITLRLTRPGLFQVGETLDFGETVSSLNITIYLESGIYYEDYPIRLPANCTISGDDFRRTIIRPLNRVSQSPWRGLFFYRDAVIDGIQTGQINFDHDYTTDTTATTATLGGITGQITITLGNNVQALQSWIGKVVMDATSETGTAGKAVINTVSSNILNCTVIYPFASITTYSANNWHIFGTNNYGRHYLTNPLLPESDTNQPKNNKNIDVFLVNDATRIKLTTCQGHGGFMMVLDPEGQIKTKSPYAQESASFSGSLGSAKRFAGGQFIDGFAGRLFGTITGISNSGKTITVTGGVNSGLDIRPPQTPCAFYVSGFRYQLNDVDSWQQNPSVFSYDQAKCSRDVGLILNAVLDDAIFGSNYRSVTAGLSYIRSYTSTVTSSQKAQTIAGLNQARDLAISLTSTSTIQTLITNNFAIVTNLINSVNASLAPNLTYPNPSNTASGILAGATQLQNNRAFLIKEVTGWITDNITISTIPNYDADVCGRDVGYMVDAIVFDLLYGGNSSTVTVAQSYYNGSGTTVVAGESSAFTQALGRLKSIIDNVVTADSAGWTKTPSNTLSQSISGTAGSGTAATTVQGLVQNIIDVVVSGLGSAPSVVNPTYANGLNYAVIGTDRTNIVNGIDSIKSSVITYLNSSYSGGGGTVTLTLDDSTPFNLQGAYNTSTSNFTNLLKYIINQTSLDMLTGSNYKTTIASLTYLQPANLVNALGKLLATQGIDYGSTLINQLSISSNDKTAMSTSLALVNSILNNGLSALPVYSFPGITGSGNAAKAAKILQANKTFMQSEIAAWISANYNTQTIPGYSSLSSQRDTGYIVDAVTYDMLYGGNTSVYDTALSFYYGSSTVGATFTGSISGTTLTITSGTVSGTVAIGQVLTGNGISTGTVITSGSGLSWTVNNSQTVSAVGISTSAQTSYLTQPIVCAAAIARLNSVMQQLIVNTSVTASAGNQVTQDTSLPVATSTQQTRCDTLLSVIIDYIIEGTFDNDVLATTTTSSATIVVTNNPSLVNGATVTGTGIQSSTTISSVTLGTGSNGTPLGYSTVVLNKSATATGTNVVLTLSGTGTSIPSRTSIDNLSGYAEYTAYTIINNAISSIQLSTLNYLTTGAGIGINIEMGGNKSMLANDFTQVNDLGYGIFATNAALTEQVSTFTYYCHTGYWALNGAQLRSVAGSNSNGDYGLRATGYDVTELPDSVSLTYNMVQSAKVYKQGQYSSAMTPTSTTQALKVYIIGWEYIPHATSEIEIDHTASGGGIIRYEISTVTHTVVTIQGQNVLELQLSTAGNNGTSTTGLNYALYDGQIVTIRMLQNFKFNQIDNVKPVRPSTALQYITNLGDIYRIISYNLIESTGEPFTQGSGIAILATDSSFSYYKLVTDTTNVSGADPTSNATATVAYGGTGNATNSTTLTVRNVSGTINTGYVVGGIGFSGHTVTNVSTNTATFTGSISGTTLTVSGVTGTITIGMDISGSNIASGTYIVSGSGTTWTVSPSQTAASGSVTGTTQTVTVSSAPTLAPAGPVYFSSRTMGSKAGDNKIAIIALSNTASINQLQKGIYVAGWNGRTHRITNYTPSTTSSFGTYDVSSSGTTLKVTSVAGTISPGELVTGTGFDGTQYVQSVTTTTTGSTVNATVILTKAPTTTPGGTLTFGSSTNAYITIDSNPVYNNSAIGTPVYAMGETTQTLLSGSTTQKIITYNIPYNASSSTSNYVIPPPVDSTLSIANNATSGYNGDHQVVGVTNQTQITVSNTSALTVGMVVSSVSTGAVIPAGTIIQSIDSATQFTVSPACWVPANSTVSAITVATLASLTPSTAVGTGYTLGSPPSITISQSLGQQAPVRQAVATATVNSDGSLNIVIVDPGYGYTSTPVVTVTGGSGTCPTITATLSNAPSTSVTSQSGISTINMQVLYPTDPGTSGSATATTNATASLTSGTISSGGVLTATTVASGTISVGMIVTGNNVKQQSSITTTSASATGGTATITYASQTYAPFAVGQQITVSGITPAAFNGTYVVTACTTTQVQYALVGTYGPQSQAGTVSSRVYTYITANISGSGSGSTWQTATTDGTNVAVSAGAMTCTQNTITVSTTSNLQVGGRVWFTGSSLLGGVTSSTTVNGVSSTTVYYITHITGNYIGISSSKWGSPFVLTSTTGSMNFYVPAYNRATDFGTKNSISKSGTGPYLVTFNLTATQTITNGAYYLVSGSTNPLYNGYWQTTTATGAYSTITLSYPYDPDPTNTWDNTTAVFVTKEVTSGTSTSLGISKPFSSSNSATLRAGYPSGTGGQITVRISTCRATGHDFLDIGTGGFSTTNYPNQIYGNASIAADSSRQVVEETVGRVFHVSTDENGIFKVGRFFKVDQGTGTVTFAASIALSNLDGLGFKRGVVVSSFSTDATMTENAPDIVPVQSAVRGFVDLRLGLDYGGNPVPANQLIGPGYLPLNGTLAMKSNFNVGTNYITNLYMPTSVTSPFDGVNRIYVDNSVAGTNSFFKLKDAGVGATAIFVSLAGPTLTVNNVFGTLLVGQTVSSTGGFFSGQTITNITTSGNNTVITLSGSPGTTPSSNLSITFTNLASGHVPVYDATQAIWKNIAQPTGDVNITYNRANDVTGTLTTVIQPGKIYDSMVNAGAAIAQSKLEMTAASTRANATGIAQSDRGLASFDVAYFTASSGWISLASSTSTTSGIGYDKLRYVSANAILGNLSNAAQNIQELTPGSVVTAGDGIKNASFTSNGAMIVTGNGTNNTYSVTPITTASAASSLVKTGTDKSITADSLKIAGYSTITLNADGVTLQFSTPGGASATPTPVYFITATGSSTSNTVITTTGTLDTSLGTLKAKTLTTGSSSTAGTVTGNWAVQSGSTWDVTLGTLKSINLSSGASSTTGTITGQWALDASSQIDTTLGTLKSYTLTTGATSTAGTVTGLWSLSASSTFDASSGTLKSRSLSTGASGTTGSVTGTWTIANGSAFTATGIQNQANSATITADSANSPSTIVLRDSSNNFSAGTATLSGLSVPSITKSGTNGSGDIGQSNLTFGTVYASTFNGNLTGYKNVDNTNEMTLANGFAGGNLYLNYRGASGAITSVTLWNGMGSGGATTKLVAGSVQAPTIYCTAIQAGDGTGNSTTTGTIQGTWTLTTGSKLEATYAADLAEYYEGDVEYEVGTVLVFGGDKEVTTTNFLADTRVAGVVSDNAAYSMNGACPGIKILIALQGRVPVKVLGRVKKGDMLTTAAIPGYACKAIDPKLGSIIGKALEDKNTTEFGVIEVAVGRM